MIYRRLYCRLFGHVWGFSWFNDGWPPPLRCLRCHRLKEDGYKERKRQGVAP